MTQSVIAYDKLGRKQGGSNDVTDPPKGDPLLKKNAPLHLNVGYRKTKHQRHIKSKLIITYEPSVPSKSAFQAALTHTQVY